MRKKVIEQKQKVVQLRQLVSQPQCLKLLILHTPFNLNIDSLHQCINLVKLDLSKNNLASIPYLGDLPNLKFMFIHQNKLDIDSLIGVFERDVGKQTKSALSRAIVWVTYWGNKNQFNVRHYLVNHTSVLAVDQYMVVPQQKNQAIFVHKKFILPFDPITNISQIFHSHKRFNKNATQQQYMEQFWQDMHQIRKKDVQINPIIKIQKVYRGWILREKMIRFKTEKEQNSITIKQFFTAWSRQVKFSKKLRAIFKKKDKQYLLFPIKQMKLQAAKRKIIKYIQQTKKKILLRKMNLRAEYKFFNILKSNQQALRSLYNVLNIDKSSYIMIHIDGIEEFKKYVVPIAQTMNEGIKVNIQQNKNVYLRYLYESVRKRRQFLRLLEVNQKSIAFLNSLVDKQKPVLAQTVYNVQTNITNLYNRRNIHFSLDQKQKMQNIAKSIQNRKIMDLGQLKKVSGLDNKQLLRDMVRGVFFYNMGFLTNGVIPGNKINILSQFSIRKITSILKIQKMWRGINLRKKIKSVAKQNYLRNRAATKIQRWFRNLPTNHRRIFMFDMVQSLKTFNSDIFYIKINQYMNLVNKNEAAKRENYKLNFLEQNIGIFISNESKKLLLSWDSQSKNEGAYTSSRTGKKLFTQKFIKRVFDNWQFQNPIKYGEQNKYEKCQISHLFHYRTQISIINRKNVIYLQIKCASKYDCRLRVLGLKLLTYNFNHKEQETIISKDIMNKYQIQNSFKKTVKNTNSIFVSQNNSQFQIQPIHTQIAKSYNFNSKFYISNDNNQKPQKFATQLKIIIVNSQQKQVQSDKKLKSISVQQKFDIGNFLIAQTNQIKLDSNLRQPNIIQNQIHLYSRIKKDSLKNVKLQRKIKVKNKDRSHSDFLQDKQKYNFMLGDPHYHQRLTTQPDLLTNERSMGSIAIDAENVGKKSQINKSDTKLIQSRVLMRKKIAINNQQGKTNLKNIDTFTKNFINQGNFIQNQFLYGQIKRLKTQIQRNSVEQVTRVKTQQEEGHKYLIRFKDQKLKRAHEGHQKHKQQLFRSAIDKKIDYQSKLKIKSENKQVKYKSLSKKMRINFAQQCYPIIGKYSPNTNAHQK